MFMLAGGFAFGAVALLVLGRVWRELFAKNGDPAPVSEKTLASGSDRPYSPWPQALACAAVVFFGAQYIWANTSWPEISINWSSAYTPPLFTFLNTLFAGKTAQTQTIVQLALPAICYILSAGVLFYWLKPRLGVKTAKLASTLACVTPAALYMLMPTHYSLTLLLCLLCCMLADRGRMIPALLVGLAAIASDVSAIALAGVFFGMAIQHKELKNEQSDETAPSSLTPDSSFNASSAMLAGAALLAFGVLFYCYLYFSQKLPVLFYNGKGSLFGDRESLASRAPLMCYILGAPIFLWLVRPRASLALRLFCALCVICAAAFGGPWGVMGVNFPLYIMLAQWAVSRKLGAAAIIGSAVLCGLCGAVGIFYVIL